MIKHHRKFSVKFNGTNIQILKSFMVNIEVKMSWKFLTLNINYYTTGTRNLRSKFITFSRLTKPLFSENNILYEETRFMPGRDPCVIGKNRQIYTQNFLSD